MLCDHERERTFAVGKKEEAVGVQAWKGLDPYSIDSTEIIFSHGFDHCGGDIVAERLREGPSQHPRELLPVFAKRRFVCGDGSEIRGKETRAPFVCFPLLAPEKRMDFPEHPAAVFIGRVWGL